jgi:hypothetical protein
MYEDELKALFGVGRWGHIKTEAENAWYEGKDADANPYNLKHQEAEFWCWLRRWQLMNRTC